MLPVCGGYTGCSSSLFRFGPDIAGGVWMTLISLVPSLLGAPQASRLSCWFDCESSGEIYGRRSMPGSTGGCGGGPPLVACKLAVSASIFFSSSATRLSVFFWRLRLGTVTMHCRPALAHLLQVPSGLSGSGSQRTFNDRQASQARERGCPDVSCWPSWAPVDGL